MTCLPKTKTLTSVIILYFHPAMKKPVFYLCLLAFALVFMGCPYESVVPIDVPNVKVDKTYLGKWYNENSKETYEYVVTQDGDFSYDVEEVTLGSEGSESTSKFYKGHLSNVGDAQFLNLKGSDSQSYLLFKVEMMGGGLKVSDVTPHIKETFSRSADLRAFISAHMHLSYFFGEENTYVRQ